jgi:hypothetical protein
VSAFALERPRTFERGWILGAWAAGRLLVLVPAAIVHFVGPLGYTGPDEKRHLFGLLGAWDGRWYRTVAENGYLLEPGRQSDPAFFPLFPLLLRGLHGLGIGYVAAGVIVSNAAFLVALFLFEALTRDVFDAVLARRATTLLAVFPLGFVFSLGYPESLVLALICGTVLAARRDHWGLAAALAAAGTLARPETLFVALPLAVLARRSRDGVAWGAVAAPFAALGSFALYLWRTLHDPLAWTHAERAWGRQFTPLGLVRAVEDLPRAYAGTPWVVRDVVCFVLYLVLLEAARRAGAPRAWVLAGALVVLLPTFSGSFHSLGRFGLLAPPIFWGLASLRPRRWLVPVSCALLVGAVVTLPYVFP